MSSSPGIVIPRWQTSSSSRVRVSKASAFRFVSWTVCSPYPTLNLRQPSFSTRHCTDLEQSSAAYHIVSVTSCLLLLLEDILLWTLLSVITAVMPAKWHCHLCTRSSLLLTYLLNCDWWVASGFAWQSRGNIFTVLVLVLVLITTASVLGLGLAFTVLVLCLETKTVPDIWRLMRRITQDSSSLRHYQLADLQRFCHLICLHLFWSRLSFSACDWLETD